MNAEKKQSRSPLLNTLRKAFHIAMESKKNGSPPVDELIDKHISESFHRRRFMSDMIKTGVVIGTAGLLDACRKVTEIVPPLPTNQLSASKKKQPKIVIIGAGLAGLNCAYELKKSGYTSTVFEGSSRTGGRIFSKRNILAPGLTTELGGEFIDSEHKDMLRLCAEFGLDLLDTLSPEESQYARDSFYINGRFYSEGEVIKAFHPFASAIAADINSLPDEMTYDNHDATTEYFDHLSLPAYLDSIGMHGFLREGIEVAYLTEYGLETEVQPSINFLFLFSPKTAKGFKIFGSSDERYKIQGGNQRLTNALYEQVEGQVVLEHVLVKIKSETSGYTLYFKNSNYTTVAVSADIIVSAIPFSLLREVTLDVDLPAWKRNAIMNLKYGTNAKLLIGFNSRVWRNYKYSGYAFTDRIIQSGWDNSQAQLGNKGGYTVFQGGKKGLQLGEGIPALQAIKVLLQMERMWPGCAKAFNGNVKRMHWPSYPFTKGSYSCYTLGAYTTIRGAEAKPVDNFYFAGEHCSANFQGFMNGAAETGRKAARNILKAMKVGQTIEFN